MRESKIERDIRARIALSTLAEYCERRHALGEVLTVSETLFGTRGPLIAGGFREDWPETVKARIRVQWSGINAAADEAFRQWQLAGRRVATLRRALHDPEFRARLVSQMREVRP